MSSPWKVSCENKSNICKSLRGMLISAGNLQMGRLQPSVLAPQQSFQAAAEGTDGWHCLTWFGHTNHSEGPETPSILTVLDFLCLAPLECVTLLHHLLFFKPGVCYLASSNFLILGISTSVVLRGIICTLWRLSFFSDCLDYRYAWSTSQIITEFQVWS